MALLTIITGIVVAYLILMIILHKLFEKFFMLLFFGLSALFAVAVIYFVSKGI